MYAYYGNLVMNNNYSAYKLYKKSSSLIVCNIWIADFYFKVLKMAHSGSIKIL